MSCPTDRADTGFFYEVELTDKKQKIMLMTEFRLADIKEAVRDSSDVISVEYR